MSSSHSIDCTDVRVFLSGYLDDELDAGTRHTVDRHLVECRACRTIVSRMESLDDLVQAGTDHHLPVPLSLVDGVVAQAIASGRSNGKRGRASKWWPTLGWMGAAACLGLAVIAWWPDRRDATTSRTNDIAANDQMASRSLARVSSHWARRSWVLDGAPVDGGPQSKSPLPTAAVAENASPAPSPEAPVASTTDIPGDAAPMWPRATLSERDDLQSIDSAATWLELLAAAPQTSYAEFERLRRIAEYDELVPRLMRARAITPASHQEPLIRAESIILRFLSGPMEIQDVRELLALADVDRLKSSLRKIAELWTPNDPL